MLPRAGLSGGSPLANTLTRPNTASAQRSGRLGSGISVGRKVKNHTATVLVTAAFLLALVPLISVMITTVANGAARFDIDFFTQSMRGVIGEGGGALHAIVGTVLITLTASIISVPLGLFTAIYLIEYGRGRAAKVITFLVDVMTGIPSIVAGLFAYALFALIIGPGAKLGIAGAISLTVLMIPVVVRSSEEMLRLVSQDLREAGAALGAPKWVVITKIVLPTALPGIVTGILLAIARVIGETAPLLVAAGYTANMNYNIFSERMQSLPVYVYSQYTNQGNPAFAFLERAWAAALVLILIVLLLNIIGRVIAKKFGVKTGR